MTYNDKLISAIREGNYEETVNCLLKGANVNYYDHGFTPLTASINNHDARISKLLLETERVSESELKSALSIAMSVKDKNITKEDKKKKIYSSISKSSKTPFSFKI